MALSDVESSSFLSVSGVSAIRSLMKKPPSPYRRRYCAPPQSSTEWLLRTKDVAMYCDAPNCLTDILTIPSPSQISDASSNLLFSSGI